MTLSQTSLTVTESSPGTSNVTYEVTLTLKPVANVTIAVANRGGSTDDADLTASPATLTFTPSNYGTDQTVRLSAAEDGDSRNGTAAITHTATSTSNDYDGLAIASVTASEADNDSNVAIVLGGVPDRTWYRNESIGTETLPAATSGNGTLTYTLTPALPAGVTLDAGARALTGTPTATAAAATWTWTATDEDGDTLSRTFTIEVKAPNTAPTSADVTLPVSRDNRTAIPLSRFSFTDKDSGHTLHGIKIIDLPGASDGTLGLVKTGIYAGAATALCAGTIEAIVAGQEILDAVSSVLYFCPGDGFTRTTFRFKVIDSGGRASSETWTATLVGPPGQVTGLKAEAGNGHVRLSWTDPENPAITGYEYRQKSGSDYGDWTTMTGSGKTTTSYSVSGLTNATAYTFQARARTAGGPGPIPLAAVTATPSSGVPDKPAGLTAKATPSGAALSWTDPKNDAITGWQYRRKAGTGSYGSWTRVPGSDVGTTSALVSGLDSGVTYTFQVRAVIEYETALGGDLAGAASDEASVTPVGVVVSKDRLALTEGGAAGTYTVTLSHAPTQDVTITVSVDSDGTVTADTDDNTTGNQTTLNLYASRRQRPALEPHEQGEDREGEGGRGRRRAPRHGDHRAHREQHRHTLRQPRRPAGADGGGDRQRRPRHHAVEVERDGDGGFDGDVHGEAGLPTERQRDGDDREERRRRR